MSDLAPLSLPTTEGNTAVLDRPELSNNSGNHDKFAHYVDERASGPVAAAYINRTPLIALCGKTWVPDSDPKRYAVCPTCIDEAVRLGLFPKDPS